MAEITHIMVGFSLKELRAVHLALGRMTGDNYGGTDLDEAGYSVYNTISPMVDDG